MHSVFPMPTTVLMDLHYLPSLAYFARLWPYATISLEAHGTYQKQTYYNRCYIRTATQEAARLTVPIDHQSAREGYRQTKIDYKQPWVDIHWRTLCTAYNKAPYFPYFAEAFRQVYKQRYTYLFDLNLALLHTCLQLLQVKKKIVLSKQYAKALEQPVSDARDAILPQNRLIPSQHYQPIPYPQVFGQAFVPNLSIVDLLFCEGRHASTILQQSSDHRPATWR